MAEVAAGAAIVGAGVSIYGQLKSAKDQSELDHFKAAMANDQANELELRAAANEAARNQVTYKTSLDFGSAFAASGREGAGIGSRLEIQRQADFQNVVSAREAKFQAEMIRKGGTLLDQAGNQTQEAGYWNAFGTALSLGGKALSPSTGLTKYEGSQTQSLPALPPRGP